MVKAPQHEPLPGEGEEAGDAVIGSAFLISLLVLGLLAVAGGAATWWFWGRPALPVVVETKLSLPAKRQLPQVSVPEIPFTDITAEAGIDFIHQRGAAGDKLLPETMGSGCAFFDFDGDGDQDLLFANSEHWSPEKRAESPATPALYANDGSGKFTDVTAGSGLDTSFYGMGIATGDYDGDGRVDVFFTAVGRNRLFRNSGEGFHEVAQAAGVAGNDDDWGTACGWFDYDNDGDLDLLMCRYVAWSREIDLAQNFQLIGGGRAYGRPQQFGGTYPSLYRNEGGGRFSDVSAMSGVQVSNPATGQPAGKTLGLAFADFDDDGWLDVVMANDTVGNFLLRNRGHGTFEEIGYLAGVAYDSNGTARGAMGIDIAHFRNDSDLGIAIGNFSNEMTALYVSQGKHLQFRDDAVSNGLGPPTRLQLTFGVFFCDLDLDGRLDFFAANGHLEDEINRVQASQHYAQPPHLFWNAGLEASAEFLPVPADKCGPDLLRPLVGRGAAYADIDGDGDLDLVMTASGGPPRLLRNDQQLKHHWLRVKLVGQTPNIDAIGASVELHQRGVIARRLISPTRSYLSQCELPATFGLGDDSNIEKVVVRWPNGTKTELTDLPVDRLTSVHEKAR
jgi:hypothetical protein